MSTLFTPSQLDQLRRDAKRLVRKGALSHSQALDRIAAERGYKNWSLLAKHSSAPAESLATQKPRAAAAEDKRQRFYLHGDQLEGDPQRYFCANCDVFFDAAHFASHGPHTGERYLVALERWNKRDERSHRQWRRPEGAMNLLEVPAMAARAEYQALRQEFSDWLMAQRRRQDPVGFMAGTLLSHRGVPRTPLSLPHLRKHNERRGFPWHALEALYAAWQEFKALRSSPSN
jgi:hypothetical protein